MIHTNKSRDMSRRRFLNFFELPLPEFLKVKGSDRINFPVNELSDEEIRQLAKLWGKALIERKNKKP